MSEFNGFRPAALTFLRQIKRNNRREWFLDHKPRYEAELLEPMRDFVEEIDVRLASLAPEIVGDPRRSIFRIYRDVRFSNDKTPYKTHTACWFTHRSAGHGVGSETHGAGAGFYFHLEPGASVVAGGVWMPPRPSLNAIREALVTRPDTFVAGVSGRAFKRRFGGLTEEGRLTRVPRGYPADHPAAAWLRFVSFTSSAPLTDDEVLDPHLPKRLMRDFALLLPFVRWLNGALGLHPADHR